MARVGPGRVLAALDVKEVLLCEWALREGLILDYLHGHARSVARAEAYPDVRRRSVVALAERCGYDEAHARQVAHLALELFDATTALHGLGTAERALLEHAALLHDIGRHISYPDRHRHTEYLVRNGLRGFDPREVDLVALIARYHRAACPGRRTWPSPPSAAGPVGGAGCSPASCGWPTPSTAAIAAW